MKSSTNNLIRTALIVFIVFNLLLVLKLRKANNYASQFSEPREKRTELLLNNIFFHLESEGALMIDNIMVESETGDTTTLKAILSRKPLLLLRYSELHCNLCVDHSISYLKSLADSVGQDNIAILTSYRTIRDLFLFKRINQIDFPVYRIPENSLTIPADKYGFPYLFITDHTLVAKYIHIPDKDVPELTRILLAVIPSKFRELQQTIQ